MELGEKLRTLRKEQNLSQEALAEKLKVSRQSISKWESGQSLPEIQKILLICDLFGISADEFLRGEIDLSKAGRAKSSGNNHFKQWIKSHQRELIITFAFILTVSLIFNFEGKSTIKDYQSQNEWVRDQLYVSYFDELELYHDHVSSAKEQEILLASSELMVSSRRIREMANHHLMLDIDNEANAVSSLINGAAISVQWVTETLENPERLTPNKIERINEIPGLLGKILQLERDLQNEIETHGYDIEDTEVYEQMHTIVIEMAMLTFAHGFEAEQIRL